MRRLALLFFMISTVVFISCRDTKKEDTVSKEHVEHIEEIETKVEDISNEVERESKALEKELKELDSL